MLIVNDAAEDSAAARYVYLPLPFWLALHDLEKRALAEPKGWLIQDAKYQVAVPPPSEPAESSPSRYSAGWVSVTL